MIKKLLVIGIACLIFTFVELQAQTITIPDPAFKAALLTQNVDTNGDGDIQVSEAAQAQFLFLDSLNIGDLTGIEYFTGLSYLDCSNNHLTYLDLSNTLANSPYIEVLDFRNNQLTQLILPHVVIPNSYIQQFYCYNNLITDLDLSFCETISYLECQNNQLSQLKLCKYSNWVDCSFNQLSYLDVSNRSITRLYCNDNQLSQINLQGARIVLEFLCYNNQLSNLDISSLGMVSVLGYHKLPYSFDCSNNLLTNLKLGGEMLFINCENNQLSAIDLTGLDSLQLLEISHNNITQLDLTGQVPKLLQLDISSNQLTDLELGQRRLATLNCSHNYLTNLSFSNVSSLRNLNCSDNQLTGLKVNGFKHLSYLNCSDNQLQSLYVKRDTTLWDDWPNTFNFSNNLNLTDICVDSVAIAAVQTKATSYGLNLSNVTIDANCALANKTFANPYPNPASDVIHLYMDSKIQKVQVYDFQGNKVHETESVNDEMDISSLRFGIYVLRIYTDKGIVIKKIIKN